MSNEEPTREERAKLAEMKFWVIWGIILFFVYISAIAAFIMWKGS